ISPLLSSHTVSHRCLHSFPSTTLFRSIVVTHEQSDDAMPAEVGVVEPLGSHLLLTLTLGSQVVKVATRTDFQVKPRDRVWLRPRSEEHTSELQSLTKLVCRLLLEEHNT